MPLKEKMVGDVAVIQLFGKWMGGLETTELNDKVKDLIGKDQVKVVADMGKVTLMNNTGLGALMSAMTSLSNAKGGLKLANIPDNVQNLLGITKLVTIFDVLDTVDLAVAAFQK